MKKCIFTTCQNGLDDEVIKAEVRLQEIGLYLDDELVDESYSWF